MRLIRIQAWNVKRISEIDLNLQGHHIFVIGGKNKAGKSSAIDAVQYAMCGKKSIPEKPLRNGEKSGKIRLTLQGHDDETQQDGLIVEREFFEDGSTQMKLLSDDGFEAPQPQRLLDDLYSKAGFDPLAFTKLGPKEQLDSLRKIVGLDFTELDRERQKFYDQRTLVNNQGKALKARIEGMPVHADAPEAEVNVADLMNLLGQIQKHNDKNAAARRDLSTAQQKASDAKAKHEIALADVANLEKQLAEAREKAGRYAVTVSELNDSAIIMNQAVEEMKNEDPDPVKKQISEADTRNRKLRENKQRAELDSDLTGLRTKSKELSDKMEDIDATKQESMKLAKWPVDGLGFAENGVTLNGLPFEQASSAEQWDTSIAIGMVLHPKLRLMVIRDGSLLDDDTMTTIDKRVKDNDYQCIVEVVTRNATDEERCCVVIEEGKVKAKAVTA